MDDVDKKRILVKKFTEAASEVYGIPQSAFIVIIKENSLENIGSGGELLVDRMKK